MRGEINVSSAQPSFQGPYEYQSGNVIAGRYLLEESLGEGGMGVVWRARHVVLNTPVAIKLVRPELRYTDVAQRLMLEAQVEAQLKHPNIVRVSDFGHTEIGDSFMVMELLSGRSLAKELELSGAMEPEQAVRLILPVLDALAYAHACGIVHRDIKPENIFLARSEAGGVLPKIVDFGIAAQEHSAPVQSRITCRGTLLGSPPYMPPEQALGGEVDHRADIWSIAVVLYEMVEGEPLFDGATCEAVLRQVLHEEIVGFSESTEANASLWSIIRPALARDIDERAQSVRELGCALAQWLLARGVTTDSCGAELALSWSPEARALQPVHIDIEGPLRAQQIAALQLADTARRVAERPSGMPTLRKIPGRKTAWAGAVATVLASLGFIVAGSFDRGPEVPVAVAQEPITKASELEEREVEPANDVEPASASAAQLELTPPEGEPSVQEEQQAEEPAPPRARPSRLQKLGLKDPY
jgi:tRNA A-37 threonylcarbamoyl transferase component Bud32